MPKYDESSASCQIFTYKEGLLAAVAHDLRISVTSFSVDVKDDGSAVSASFDATSVKTDCAMKDGAPTTSLSDKDKADIDANILKDVLITKKHPKINFGSTKVTERAGGYTISGWLEIKGRKNDVSLTAKVEGAELVIETSILQPDYGVKPFSALFGTLKIKPEIKVRMVVPKP